tara:strand:- start:17405 stop:18664 length:1260 start_codon:yes stop_codon:yes gene_type:complete
MKKKILLRAPLLTRSGYGEQARFALRSLRSREDIFDIYIQPLQWGTTSWIASTDDERAWIDERIERSIAYVQQGGQFDMSLQVTIPNEWESIAPFNIGFTAGIETNKVAPVWLQKGNEFVNKIIVVSKHARDVYRDTLAIATNTQTGEEIDYKLETPIEFVNYPAKNYENLEQLDLNLKNDFNFLAVAQFGPRKNLPNTIKWFVEEFHDEEVGLILKTNMSKNCFMDRENVLFNIKTILSQFPNRKCTVNLLHGDMSDEEMHSLYRHPKVSALLALPHGEGFGLPIFEASYSGLPVIATAWSGHLDFLIDEEGNENYYSVSFDLQPVQEEVVWENVLIRESMWAYPREQSAKEKMRQCYEDITNKTDGTFAINACEYSMAVQDRFAPSKMYKKFVDEVLGFDSSLIEPTEVEPEVVEFE